MGTKRYLLNRQVNNPSKHCRWEIANHRNLSGTTAPNTVLRRLQVVLRKNAPIAIFSIKQVCSDQSTVIDG